MPGKLIYFGLEGRAASMRSMLTHAGVEYENCHVTMEEHHEMKASFKTPMGPLPIWEEDGFVICQSNAIMRFLAIRHGYYSEDPEICFNIDSLMDFTEDIMSLFGNYYHPMLAQQGPPTEHEKFLQFWDKHIQVISARLQASGKPYAAGTDKPTCADFKLFAPLMTGLKEMNPQACGTPDEIHDQVVAKIEAAPLYKAWIERMKETNSAYLAARQPVPL